MSTDAPALWTATADGAGELVLHTGRPRHGARPIDRPAQTLTTHAQSWTFRLAAPPAAMEDADSAGYRAREPLTLRQASILQGFSPSYPWQGLSARDRFRQLGNAVCPPVARAVLAEAIRPSLTTEGPR